jgi:hypothetical protein
MKKPSMKTSRKARARRDQQKTSNFSLEHIRKELSYRGRRWQPDGEVKESEEFLQGA